MTEQEAYQEHIRYTHDTYCRIVIRHASFDAARMLAARWKREISLEYLTEEKFVPLSTTDEYFQVPDYASIKPPEIARIIPIPMVSEISLFTKGHSHSTVAGGLLVMS